MSAPPGASRFTSLARRAAWASIALLFASCHMLIDGELPEVRCQDEGAIGPPACPTGQQCKLGVCGKAELGALCTTDADCGRGDLCLDPASYGGRGKPRCSRTCCTSADCDPDGRYVCWNAPHGAGNYCYEAAALGRAQGGAGHPHEKCDHDDDCRSGLCRDRHCADTCCSDTSCAAGGGACRFTPGHDGGSPPMPPGGDDPGGFWCAVPAEKKPRYAVCKQHADCASGLCIPLSPTGDMRCSTTCCDSKSCEVFPDKPVPIACTPVLVEDVWIHACTTIVLGEARGEVGNECTDDGDCRSGSCVRIGSKARCTDTCCTDASCGDPSSFVCRPAGGPASWALRCEPK